MKKINIVFTGEGGQGIQTIAKIFSYAAIEAGFEVTYIPSFGVEQRGTPSIAYVTLGKQKLRYPKFEAADYVIILQTRAISAIEKYVFPETKVIFDSSTIAEKDLPKASIQYQGIPATKIAQEQFNIKSFNILVLGFLTKLFNLDPKIVWETVETFLGKKFKDEKIRNQNFQAFEYGQNFSPETKEYTKASFKAKHKAIIYKGHGKIAQLFPKRCKGCGVCIEKCPVGALSFSTNLGVYATPIPEVDLEKCIACGNCRLFCPDGAIMVNKENSK